jgi:flagellar hook-length control protein FliK
VIAIVPKIGTGNAPATPSPSQIPSANNSAKQSFSSLLQQAQPSAKDPVETQAGRTQTPLQGSYSPANALSPVNAPSKRDAKTSDNKSSDSKPSDSKTNDSEGNTPAQTPVSRSQDQTVPVVLVQPQLTPALGWNFGMKDSAPDPDPRSTTLNDKGTPSSPSGAGLTARPDTAGPSISPATSSPISPATSTAASPAKPEGNASSQDSPSPQSAESANADAIKAEAVASLIASLSGTAAADSKTQPGNTLLPARNVARSSDEAVNQALAAVKSEIEQTLVPPSVTSPTLYSPAPGQLETGNSQGTSTKVGLDKSGMGSTDESLGTTRKIADAIGSTKSQSRKDDTSSTFSSPGDDQGAVSVPAKTSDPSAAFSVAGIQPSTTASDEKSVAVSTPSAGSDQQSGQLDQKSTGVVQTPAPGEAYPTSLVHSAKLVERIGEAELRLGIRAGEFGSVDIRTSMVRNQFTAEISTERGELGRAMAAELPSLQNRLNEQRVPVGNITLQNHAGGHSAASEQQKSREGQQVYATHSGSGPEKSLMPALAALEAAVPASRLDIHM